MPVDEETRRLLLIAAALAVNGHALCREYARVCVAVGILTPILFFLWNGIQPIPSGTEFTTPLAGVLCAIAALSAMIAAVSGLPFVVWRRLVSDRSRNPALPSPGMTDPAAWITRRAAAFSLSLRVSSWFLWAVAGIAVAYCLAPTDAPRSEAASTDEQALARSVGRGDVLEVRELLDRGIVSVAAEPESREASLTLLNVAVGRNDPHMVSLLLAHGADVNSGDGWLRTPLAVAAEAGNVEMMRLLIHRGATINDGTRGSAALWNAVVNGQTAATRFLLTRGADPNTTVGPSVLRAARERGLDAEIVRLLIAAGAG